MNQSNEAALSRRARVFELMSQKNREAAGQARIRKMARKGISDEDVEQFKIAAMQSLQTGRGGLPAKNA